MSDHRVLAVLAYVAAAVIALLITQTKARPPSRIWLVPAVALVAFASWTAFAFAREDVSALLAGAGSLWGMQVWFNLLISVTVAFFFLQPRARKVGMKSEVWVLLVVLTGGLGLLFMLAQMLYLESRASPLTSARPLESR